MTPQQIREQNEFLEGAMTKDANLFPITLPTSLKSHYVMKHIESTKQKQIQKSLKRL